MYISLTSHHHQSSHVNRQLRVWPKFCFISLKRSQALSLPSVCTRPQLGHLGQCGVNRPVNSFSSYHMSCNCQVFRMYKIFTF